MIREYNDKWINILGICLLGKDSDAEAGEETEVNGLGWARPAQEEESAWQGSAPSEGRGDEELPHIFWRWWWYINIPFNSLRTRFHAWANYTPAISNNLGTPVAHSTEASFREVVDLEYGKMLCMVSWCISITFACDQQDKATGQNTTGCKL